MKTHTPRVSLETGLPGDPKIANKAWTIRAGFADTWFGLALLAECPRGLCHLSFLERGEKTRAWDELLSVWPGDQVTRDDQRAEDLASGIFREDGMPPAAAPLRAFVRGTEFQIKVWQALLAIPFGGVVSYSRIAESIGHAAATRATGTAVGKNPLAWVIPCHRVIGKSGQIGNYRWGSARKRSMLAWESGRGTEPQGNSRISMSR